jgi:hypothetical protein
MYWQQREPQPQPFEQANKLRVPVISLVSFQDDKQHNRFTSPIVFILLAAAVFAAGLAWLCS